MSLSILRACLRLCVHGREEEKIESTGVDVGGWAEWGRQREDDREGSRVGGRGGRVQRRGLWRTLIGHARHWLAAAADSQRSWESGTARRADYEAELNQRQSPFIVSMAAHAFLLCSLALLSALNRPGLSFTEDELQPGLIYDEVPEILDRR